MTYEKRKRKWPRLNLRGALFLLFFCAFLVLGGLYAFDLRCAEKEARAFEALATRVEDRAAAADRESLSPPSMGQEEPAAAPDPLIEERLAAYRELREENPDFYGWLSIPGTQLDYPVMHTPDDPERYLRRAFDGQYSVSGTPFLDGACFAGCGNYIIYGHMMRNGSMFAPLKEYADQAFWQEHPVIRFDTPEEAAEYEVLAVFYARAYRRNETDVFRYYKYTDLTDEARFNAYLEQARAAALYDTGVTAQYGDELLTLSTCSYHTSNGRFVVVAKKTD